MKEFNLLKLLDKFKKLFLRLGIDYIVMRKIIQIKLTLDARRTPTVMMDSNSSKKKDTNKEKNMLMQSLWVYAMFGLILVPLIVLGNNLLFQISLTFGIIMFMMTLTMISDFSTILLDLKDKNIILSKPVNSRTLNAAKIIHIAYYMLCITISLIGPGLIAGAIKHGLIFSVIFFIGVILMDFLIIVVTALLYLIVLRFFDGEKLKDIINYFQIIFAITMAIGYQALGRVFEFDQLFNIEFIPKLWHYALPPMWFGGTFELILNNDRSMPIIIFSMLALLVPIIAIIAYVKFVPVFEDNLHKLNNTSEKVKSKFKGLSFYLSEIFCREKDEKTFFRFSSSVIKNEREFKLKVYPTLGMSLIFPFIFIFGYLSDGGLVSLRDSRAFLSIYFIALQVPTIISSLECSANYKGAWIYGVAPVKDQSHIFKGTLKTALVNLILPLYLVMSVALIILYEGRILLDLVIIFLAIWLYAVICFKTLDKSFPFSKPFEDASKESFIIVIMLMTLLGALALVHYISMSIPYGKLIYLLALVIVSLIVWEKAFAVNTVV